MRQLLRHALPLALLVIACDSGTGDATMDAGPLPVDSDGHVATDTDAGPTGDADASRLDDDGGVLLVDAGATDGGVLAPDAGATDAGDTPFATTSCAPVSPPAGGCAERCSHTLPFSTSSFVHGSALSPRGDQIAVTVSRFSGAGPYDGTWVMALDGSDQHRISTIASRSDIAYEPDGSGLYLSHDWRVEHLPFDSVPAGELIGGGGTTPQVAASPSGTRLLVESRPFTLPAESAAPTSTMYSSLTSLFAAEPDYVNDVSYSPDGAHVAFGIPTADGSRLVVVDATTHAVVTTIDRADAVFGTQVAWQDANHVLFASHASTPSSSGSTLERLDIRSGSPVTLYTVFGNVANLDAAGNTVLFDDGNLHVLTCAAP